MDTTTHPHRKVLLLLDGPAMRREAVRYSLELAQRTGSGVCLLMLLRRIRSPGGERLQAGRTDRGVRRRAAERALTRCVEEMRACGVEADGVVREGDPGSELIKFLAGSAPCQAAVWGGTETFLRGGGLPVRGHWLERMRDELDCPLVVPSWKRKPGGKGVQGARGD